MNAIPEFRALAVRSRMLQSVRAFLVGCGYTEVETPVRIAAPALETFIDAEPSGAWYLRTSPELHMKRLLAAGMDRIFQLGPCFRARERGRLHNPEFTMLEWYCRGAGYLDILETTRALLLAVTREVTGGTEIVRKGHTIDLSAKWAHIPVRDAFLAAAGWDPMAAFDQDRFDLDLVNLVEPSLPPERPAVLIDYPACVAALARRKLGCPEVAERWELYAGGMELANAFTELTDPGEQRARFIACAGDRRAAGREVYPLDEDFLAALERGLPPCAGVAVGIDRLAMLLTGTERIDEVRPFCV